MQESLRELGLPGHEEIRKENQELCSQCDVPKGSGTCSACVRHAGDSYKEGLKKQRANLSPDHPDLAPPGDLNDFKLTPPEKTQPKKRHKRKQKIVR